MDEQGDELSDDGPLVDGAELAALLRVSQEQLVQVLGAGWRRQTALPDNKMEQWFVSGEPPQVAVGFDGDHRFAAEDLLHDSQALAEKAEEIARGRLRSFRWCRTCREVNAPESFLRGDGICMDCAAAHHHMVF